jgi:uncharacterized membrane protein
MQAFERFLVRWRGAGLLDEATESAILRYEESQAKPSGRRWQVILALVMGGILLGAGVLLFVAAHWDEVSPLVRLALVMAMLALFHVAGVVSRERFSGFATTMHALGTVSCGAAIALIGHAGALAGGGNAVGHLRSGGVVAAGRRVPADAGVAAGARVVALRAGRSRERL